ncbi:hypothetical protein AN0100.2 [Aspergillus nidulans FGSC A4]|uniref:Alcohol dehydrogenase-like N-terminal domain-containing protein n=1 Tax=Emericella nidulans (strain FGSC A4 / ATCC 38163 / CBS 112.46 / NRRL 194 / M139) TaxID=227321 RepID=Q5BH80_EMENI|nr:hypothetical protein [Aspergillus nidulans FGSC A4]EAA65278.1 hypothetical protein AN0100.2 [Aspergillus nidulans FGSC A4]CBF90199.1 TPA: conserved hypothetical protein [Aspergillus nidulans FGSC A4]|eukprot:XP_657704.1 hypothetical protein AN0100.2 [Aspergillus nidulans FGSC A4]
MAPQLMKAAVCKKTGQPIVIEQVPVPVPQGREVLARVQAVSLCHSDITITSGGLGPIQVPFIVGHEAVSVVEALGPDSAKWASRYFAEYTLVDAASAVVIPKDVIASPASLAPLFCAGLTVWNASKRARLQVTDVVAIVGAGGLGQIACQYAHAMGVRFPAYATTLSSVRAEGRIVAVGIPSKDIPIAISQLISRALQKFRLEDINEMIDLMKAGKVEKGRMVAQFF